MYIEKLILNVGFTQKPQIEKIYKINDFQQFQNKYEYNTIFLFLLFLLI